MDLIRLIWKGKGVGIGLTHVRFSPLGLKNHAAREAATTMIRPTMRLQLDCVSGCSVCDEFMKVMDGRAARWWV